MEKFLQNILILIQMWVWKEQELHFQELFDQLLWIHGSHLELQNVLFLSFPSIQLSHPSRRKGKIGHYPHFTAQEAKFEGELEGEPRFSGQLGASHNVDAPPGPEEERSG